MTEHVEYVDLIANVQMLIQFGKQCRILLGILSNSNVEIDEHLGFNK